MQVSIIHCTLYEFSFIFIRDEDDDFFCFVQRIKNTPHNKTNHIYRFQPSSAPPPHSPPFHFRLSVHMSVCLSLSLSLVVATLSQLHRSFLTRALSIPSRGE